jgi:hypothetical protein
VAQQEGQLWDLLRLVAAMLPMAVGQWMVPPGRWEAMMLLAANKPEAVMTL